MPATAYSVKRVDLGAKKRRAWRGGDGGSQAAAKQSAAPSFLLTALLLHPLPPMGAHRGPPLLAAAFLLLLAAAPAVLADTNVTVDDTDSVSIVYDPPSSWAESTFNSLDAGGSHATTADADATATFSFTGAQCPPRTRAGTR